jgi:hypothetical protein
MVKATCTWGEGEDVLVALEKHSFLLYENPKNLHRATHGYVDEGSFFLTAEEARKLAAELLSAANSVDELEAQLEIYMNGEKCQSSTS